MSEAFAQTADTNEGGTAGSSGQSAGQTGAGTAGQAGGQGAEGAVSDAATAQQAIETVGGTTQAAAQNAGPISIGDGPWAYFIEAFGPSGPFYVIAAIGMGLALFSLPFLLRKTRDPIDRLGTVDERRDGDLGPLRNDGDSGSLQSIGGVLEPMDEAELSETRQKLAAAGYKDKSAVRIYYFARAALGLGLLCFGILMMIVIPSEPDMTTGLVVSAAFGLAGYFGPAYWVARQIETRREQIQNAFPDAMDMLLVCIEGGQSLEQAMQRVGKEMEIAPGPLSEELQVVSHQFRAGKDRVSVLRDFAARCNVNDISSFVTVLIQSTAFGTSISQALRVYAAEMRDKRLMRAEEKANTLPTKLTLGTMMFTVPPLILILIGPSVIQILRALTGLTTGGG